MAGITLKRLRVAVKISQANAIEQTSPKKIFVKKCNEMQIRKAFFNGEMS